MTENSLHRYFIEDHGCQMTNAESGAMASSLREKGWTPAEKAEDSDLVIINTCAIRKSVESRILGRLGSYKTLRETTRARYKIALVGCMAQEYKELKKEAPHVDFLVGTYAKKKFIDSVEELLQSHKGGPTEVLGDEQYRFFSLHALRKDGNVSPFRAYVPIMHGCNQSCHYCIVPKVRGAEQYRAPEEIVKEVQTFVSQGVKEITLLGQTVNSYHARYKGTLLNFPALLQLILKETDVCWLKYVSSHPAFFTPDLLALMGSEPRLAPQIHVAIQHSSDSVLKAMNRLYTKNFLRTLFERFQQGAEPIHLTTDFMVGYPGETEADVQDLLNFMDEIRFRDAFMFYYNVREGTVGAALEQIPIKVRKERLVRIIEKQKQLTNELYRSRVGEVDEVLVERLSSRGEKRLYFGHTRHSETAIFSSFPGMELGQIYKMKITAAEGKTLTTEVLRN